MKDFSMFIHNLISHPLMAVLHLLGFERAAAVVHDMTLPSLSLDDLDDDDKIVAVFRIPEEDVEAGRHLAELLTLCRREIGINKRPINPSDTSTERVTWEVSYKYGEAWHQVTHETLNGALSRALDQVIDLIANGGEDDA